MNALTIHEIKVLKVLDGLGGYTTGEIARRVDFRFGHNARTHSARVRQILLGLQKTGLVTPIDDQKPVVWSLYRMPRENPCPAS